MISLLKKAFPRWFIHKGLLSYEDLCVLVELGIINAPIDHINGSSIDVTLDKLICVEDIAGGMDKIDLASGQTVKFTKPFELDQRGYMMPNTILLASTAETFNMPPWLSAEFSLKSSLARCGLGHLLAGWIDPCFNGKVTLELINHTKFHKLILRECMKIGQVKFFKHAPVPDGCGYDYRGQYNGQDRVQPSRGVK